MMSPDFRVAIFNKAERNVPSMAELYAYYMNVINLTEFVYNPILIDEYDDEAKKELEEFAAEKFYIDFPEDSYMSDEEVKKANFSGYYTGALITSMKTVNELWYYN